MCCAASCAARCATLHLLGAKDPLMWKLVPALVREMGQAYPELMLRTLIVETLRTEETRFRTTLARGLSILDGRDARPAGRRPPLRRNRVQALRHLRLSARPDAGRAARPQPRRVDTDGFEAAMERQRADARKAWAGSAAATEAVWFWPARETRATEFLGYDTETAEGVLSTILVDDGKGASATQKGASAPASSQPDAVLRRIRRSGRRFRRDTRPRRALPRREYDQEARRPHRARRRWSRKERSRRRRTLELDVDHSPPRRGARQPFGDPSAARGAAPGAGDHVAQKGSLVAPDRLRFDFSHPKPISDEGDRRIEDIANRVVLENAPCQTRLMAVDDAIASGARALFGEKYGDEVRVVSMGAHRWPGQSSLFGRTCGGTHVNRTGDIGLVSIVSEGAVAIGRPSPYRRPRPARRASSSQRGIEALARDRALVRAPPRKRPTVFRRADRGSQAHGARTGRSAPQARNGRRRCGAAPFREIAGVKFLSRAVSGVEMKDLKSLADEAKKALVPASWPSPTPAPTARAASSSPSRPISIAASTRSIFVRIASGGARRQGRRRTARMAQAGGPDGSQVEGRAFGYRGRALRQKAAG